VSFSENGEILRPVKNNENDMSHKRKIFSITITLILIHLTLVFVAAFTPLFYGTPMEAFGITVLVLPYLLADLGLPVLNNSGFSESGWSNLNLLGWTVSGLVWFCFYYLVSILLGKTINFLTCCFKNKI
jgi:hypothetical protein